MDFYYINKEYLNYLNKIDNKVPKVDLKHYKHEKYYIGVVLNINDNNYFAPISSNKNAYPTSFLIKNSDNQIISSIRLNYMIPVDFNTVNKLNLNKFKKEDIKYYNLLKQERKKCLLGQEKIKKIALKSYNIATKKNKIKFNENIYCDYKKLEKACDIYPKFQLLMENYLDSNGIALDDVELSIDNDELVVALDDEEIRLDKDTDIEMLIDDIENEKSLAI